MYLTRLIPLLIFLLANDALGVEISITDELVESEIGFYTQSEGGELITCGVEFSGIDSNLYYFTGSYGFIYFEDRGPVPILKVKSIKLDLDGTRERKKIKKAWLKSTSASTLSGTWVAGNQGESFLLVGGDVLEGSDLYYDIIDGEDVKIGYLHEGNSIDRVYRLKRFTDNGDKASIACISEMTERFLNKQLQQSPEDKTP